MTIISQKGEPYISSRNFTMDELKQELYALLPSHGRGRDGEITSWLQLVTWLLRSYADESLLAAKVQEFNSASQENGDEESAFYSRLRRLNSECRYIHRFGPMKGRFLSGVQWELQTEVRQYNTRLLPIERLVTFAQQKGNTLRRQKRDLEASLREQRETLQAALEKQEREREDSRLARAAAYRARAQAAKQVVATVGEPAGTSSSHTAAPPASPSWPRRGTPGQPAGGLRCLTCDSTEHTIRFCPGLDAGTKAKLDRVYQTRMAREAEKTAEASPRGVVGAVDSPTPTAAEDPPDPSDPEYQTDSGESSGNE